jgi:hypothetical protein
MEKIIKFLSNPYDTGLNIKIYRLDLEKLAEFVTHTRSSVSERDFIEKLLKRDEVEQKRYLSDRLNSALSQVIRDELAPEICEYFQFRPEDLDTQISDDEKRIPGRWIYRRFVRGFLRPRIYPKYLEILHVDYKISKRNKVMMIELVSLKEIGLKLFGDLISCLSGLSDSLIEISSRKSHSEKYIFKLYPLVVQLWVDEENRFLLNENIKNFINASIRYYTMREWRTSIVLSSIAVESIFAELYEEAYKKNAPDIPLGGLIKQVEKIITLPEDLSKKIYDLNKTRIASVHRSENPVSDKDAIISLMGVTSLSMWYFDNY